MDRKRFLKISLPILASLPLIGKSMNLKDLFKFTSVLKPSPRMPVLFLGHGSPMNAIEENSFVRGFRTVGKQIEKPSAILCISAHWETKGTFVTAMPQPRTIHDFGGFPRELFEVKYPAPGSPELAYETQQLIKKTSVGLDQSWGLDHGAWSVLKHLFPLADIPVVQMSIDYSRGPQYHFELGRELSALRNKGVLIVGSGNMVHNLGLVSWNRLNEEFAFEWAAEASEKMKSFILGNNFNNLVQYASQGKAFQLAIPTPEHYYPLLYALALKDERDSISLFNDKPVAGSLTMTSVKITAGS